MAPRKRELLDVLRRQQSSSAPAESRPTPQPAPRSAPLKIRFGPAQKRTLLRIGLVVVWLVLVVWLVRLLTSGGDEPKLPSTGTQVTPAQGPPATTPPNAGNDPPASTESAYGVLAITYQGDAQLENARRVGQVLQKDLRLPEVHLHRSEDRGKVWYELFVGRAGDPAALDLLLKQVRGLALPGEPGKPFASAYVKLIPSSGS